MMELPFAVESSGVADGSLVGDSSALQQSDSSSLVTASSQGSFMDTPLPPYTPQDVVLPPQFAPPHHLQPRQQKQHRQGQLVVTPASPQDGGDPDNDFTYVNVTETDADEDDEVDILLGGVDISLSQDQKQSQHPRGDILTALLSSMQPNESDSLMSRVESANDAGIRASEAKQQGDLLSALEFHTQAANLYKDSAISIKERNSSLASSLFLLSQTQARSAIALKGIVKLNPTELRQILPPSSKCGKLDANASSDLSPRERLRAAVRGALGSRHPHEADITESQFLGDATSASPEKIISQNDDAKSDDDGTLLTEGQDSPQNSANPVDEMMELERELRDMDMALELGNSISSLDSRIQHRMKASMIDGSFMVVPPGSQSYMASSMWSSGHIPHNNSRHHPPAPPANQGTAGVRARANRVQNISTSPGNRPPMQVPHAHVQNSPSHKNSSGLESSWWGNASTTSQVLTSSVISLGVRTVTEAGPMSEAVQSSSTNTKQIMRLMDSLKTLGDENATLLREVEELETARAEAKATRDALKKFKEEYGRRFSSLKKALEKFRQEHPNGQSVGNNPVHTSDFMKNASVSDQLQRQEHLIRKLTTDLKKEKEESKKKDTALRKYESFYREVKARSAQKAAQRQQMENQQQRQSQGRSRATPPRGSQYR